VFWKNIVNNKFNLFWTTTLLFQSVLEQSILIYFKMGKERFGLAANGWQSPFIYLFYNSAVFSNLMPFAQF